MPLFLPIVWSEEFMVRKLPCAVHKTRRIAKDDVEKCQYELTFLYIDHIISLAGVILYDAVLYTTLHTLDFHFHKYCHI